MTYLTKIFSPDTYNAFGDAGGRVAGFRIRHSKTASQLRPGDAFVCYVTEVSRWCAVLEIVNGPYLDDSPLFLETNDPFVVRFRVRARVWLPVEKGLPIQESSIWNGLSFTRNLSRGSTAWTGKVRGSFVKLAESDGEFLERALTERLLASQLGKAEERPLIQPVGASLRAALPPTEHEN